MPTNEERKETAKSLYELTKYGAAVPVWHAHLILGLIDDDNYVHGTVLTNDSVVRLADLIEPLEGHAEVAPDDQSMTKWHRCSRCKQPIDVSDNYCKHCGCKLLKGHEIKVTTHLNA